MGCTLDNTGMEGSYLDISTKAINRIKSIKRDIKGQRVVDLGVYKQYMTDIDRLKMILAHQRYKQRQEAAYERDKNLQD